MNPSIDPMNKPRDEPIHTRARPGRPPITRTRMYSRRMLNRAALLLPALLCFACSDPAETTATQGGSESSTGATTASTDPTTSTSSPTPMPTTSTTGDEGSGTMGGSSTGGSSSTGPSPSTSTTTDTSTGSSDDTGTSSPVDTDTGPQGTSSTGPDDTGTGTSTGADSSTGEEPLACACPNIEVPLDDGIFLLSDSAELWKYFPETNQFEMLGQINCAGLFSTFSMAVDRLGFAWVQYSGGELRKVDVTNVADCSDPGYLANQQGVGNFGMAFVSNSQSDACDRIYGNSYSGFGGYSEGPDAGDFLSITPDTLQLSKPGKTNFDGAEVTGTGDGRAFVFGGAFPSKLVEMDKAKGIILETLPLGGLEINNGAFAFAFFGGDFYFFTDSDGDLFASEVTHMDYDDSNNDGKQELTVLTQDAPLLVVGAGVSTCAPTAPQ